MLYMYVTRCFSDVIECLLHFARALLDSLFLGCPRKKLVSLVLVAARESTQECRVRVQLCASNWYMVTGFGHSKAMNMVYVRGLTFVGYA